MSICCYVLWLLQLCAEHLFHCKPSPAFDAYIGVALGSQDGGGGGGFLTAVFEHEDAQSFPDRIRISGFDLVKGISSCTDDYAASLISTWLRP